MQLVVRDLAVEIGGTTIVEGVSFDVRAGDKVGLVGRNGAGKTTLFRVLGGAATPRAGSVRRAEATGYLSQDPRADATPPDTNCLAHVLSGRGLDAAADRLAAATAAMQDDTSDAAI
ncbi:MAG: ATP-binding cassette domain-containing protein, partial [Acidimicrobiales bacterium]|nr:ATP-binding cassette domain-containing protein [Acidimicrobiales bacterium]